METKNLKNFLIISKGSIGETRSQVYRSYDAGHLSEENYNGLLADCFSLSKQLSGFIIYIEKNQQHGRFRKPLTDS